MDRGAERWERLKVYFKLAVEAEEPERVRLFERAAAEDPDLPAQLAELLDAHDGAGRLLDSPFGVGPKSMALNDATLPFPRSIGRYRILRVLGSGGMGIVYEAEQEHPKRTVAVKTLRREVMTPSALRRFQQESALLARLEHPTIAKIYEVGTHDDDGAFVPFFAMEHIRGARTITKYASEEKLGLGDRLALFASLCDAVHFGHEAGVLHRDLKPSNVLVDAHGQLRIIDFGVACSTDAELSATTMHTVTGQLIGTLAYMSPEQCGSGSRHLDARSDVYSLGVILFELVCGELPYDVNHLPLPEAARLVREGRPRRLGEVAREWRGDLEIIVATAIAKECDLRYPSAAALAADVRRHLSGETILARRPSALYSFRAFARRHKTLVAGALAVFAALSLGVATTTVAWLDARSARTMAEIALFDKLTYFGVDSTKRGDVAEGLLWLLSARVPDALPEDRIEAHRVRLRTWQRHIAAPLAAFRVTADVTDVVSHPDGRYWLVTSPENGASLIDADRGESSPFSAEIQGVNCASWSFDGTVLALGSSSGQFIVQSFPSGERQGGGALRGGIGALEFTRDGRFLVIASDDVRIWDTGLQAFVDLTIEPDDAEFRIALSRRNDRLAIATKSGRVQIYALPPGADASPLLEFEESRGFDSLPSPLFIDDDRGLLIRSGRLEVSWRNTETGARVRTLPLSEREQRSQDLVYLRASPDGARFVVATQGGAQVWDVETRRPLGPPLELQRWIRSLDFSPDGTKILIGTNDHRSVIRSVADGRLLESVMQQDSVVHVQFAPDGRRFFSVTADGVVREWTAETGHLEDFTVRSYPVPSYATLSPDGERWLPVGTLDGSQLESTRVHDVGSGRGVGPELHCSGALRAGAFSPDGRNVLTLTHDRMECWDWTTGARCFPPQHLPSPPLHVAFSPTGDRFVVFCEGGEILCFDARSGSATFRTTATAEPESHYLGQPSGIRFRPDGERFVLSVLHAVEVRESTSGRLCYPPLEHQYSFFKTDISVDGQLLATASPSTGIVKVWSLETGETLAAPIEHPDGVVEVAFHPRGDVLITACDDGFARVWDWRDGRVVCPPLDHGARVSAAAFSVDGRWAFSVSYARELRIWDWRTGVEVSPPRALPGYSTQILVTKRRVIVPSVQAGGFSGFDLSDLEGGDFSEADRARAVTLAELVSGKRVEGAGLFNLATSEWLSRFEAVREN